MVSWCDPTELLSDLRISGCLGNENFPNKRGLKFLGLKGSMNEVGWWKGMKGGWYSLDLGRNRAGKIWFLHFKNVERFWDKSEALIR
jgi:hypothetical protein